MYNDDSENESDVAGELRLPLNRRTLISGGMITGVAAFLARPGGAIAGAPGAAAHHAGDKVDVSRSTQQVGLNFTALAASTADQVVVPDGYTATVLVPWGDPIVPGGPAFRFDGGNASTEQAQQFGMGHDGMHFFRTGGKRGLLAMNHEFVDNTIMFNATPNWNDAETVLRSQNGHGVSICELELRRGTWTHVSSPNARRITPNTPMVLTGPAAGHPLLQTTKDPSGVSVLGTFNNCSNGSTPWGTYLTCEENFNGYFGTDNAAYTPTPLMNAYGIVQTPFAAVWYHVDTPFDIAVEGERIQSVRLGGRDRPDGSIVDAEEADRPWAREARGRRLRRGRQRPRRHLHQRRRTVPTAVQVRLRPPMEEDAPRWPESPRRGHIAHGPIRRGRDRSVGSARTRISSRLHRSRQHPDRY